MATGERCQTACNETLLRCKDGHFGVDTIPDRHSMNCSGPVSWCGVAQHLEQILDLNVQIWRYFEIFGWTHAQTQPVRSMICSLVATSARPSTGCLRRLVRGRKPECSRLHRLHCRWVLHARGINTDSLGDCFDPQDVESVFSPH